MAPIDSAELYGAAEASTAPGSTAQVATFVVPRDEPPHAPLQPPFAAAAVAVDNATGRWWRIAGRWVPPWTIGGMLTVDPPTNQLEVLALTPDGQVSERAGTELVIVAYSERQPPGAGIYRPPAVALTHESAYASVTYGAAATTQQLVAPVAGERIAVVGASVFAGEQSAQGYMLRGVVRVELREAVSGTVRFAGAIAPASPLAQLVAPPGAVLTAAGQGLELVATADLSIGAGVVSCWLLFYRATAA